MRSSRTLSFALAALGAISLVMPVMAAQSTAAQSYIVVFKDAAADRADSNPSHPRIDADKVARLVAAIASRTGVNPANTFSAVFGGFSARLNARQLQAVESDQSVANVMADVPVHLQFDEVGARMTETQVRLTSPKVPAGIKRVGATNNGIADIDGNGGKVNADVAVIDTGIQRDHPDLNVVGGYNCTSANRGKWDDGNGHGTHVAGIIGAYDNGRGVVGVAPGVRLWSVKVLDDTGDGLMSWIVCGIDWITSQRSSDGSRPLIDVANMSLRSTLPQGDDHNCGRTYRDLMHSALCRSVAAGTTYVVAAGNDRDDASHYRPAAYDEAITVSAMTDYDGVAGGNGTRPADCLAGYPDDTFAGFSNFGADVDLTAPGVCVLSTWAGGMYAYASGTSMAAPHVAGAAALYMAQFPGAEPDQVKMALQHVGRTDWKRSTDPDGRPDLLLWATGFDRPPDFSVAATSPAGYAGPNAQLAVPVSLTRLRGFSSTITVSMSGLPAGLSAAPVTTGNDKAVLTVTGSDKVRNGKYTATVVAEDGGLRHSTTVTIRVDGIAPTAPTSVTPGAGFWYSPDGQVTLRWSGSTDSGSGASQNAYVRRRVARASSGSCGDFSNDGDWSLLSTGYSEDALLSGYCYRWQMRAADKAGNASDPVSTGKVLVDTSDPKVTISKPAPGSTIVRSKPSQSVEWKVTRCGGSTLGGVSVQRQRATSHQRGSCAGATWKNDGLARNLELPATEKGLVSGSCYRWIITAHDKATNYSKTTSGSVLISSTATSSTETSAGGASPSMGSVTLTPSAGSTLPSSEWSGSMPGGPPATPPVTSCASSSSGGASWSTFTTPNGSTPFMALRLPAGRLTKSRSARGTAPAPGAIGRPRRRFARSWRRQKVRFREGRQPGSRAVSRRIRRSRGLLDEQRRNLRYSFTGRSVALVSTLGPGRGMADVYVDGLRATTINLSSSTLTTREVVVHPQLVKQRPHVISLQLRSSARVDVDAVVVLN